MTNEQLYILVGLPLVWNTILYVALGSMISDLRRDMNRQFDLMRELWRSELKRVEEILDGRLKHLEENR
jgi:hypothetical protein